MTVTLVNNTRRMQVFNLPHDLYCAALGRCECRMPATPKARPLGTAAQVGGAVRTRRRVCPSLTFAAGATQGGLPDAVLAAPEVDRAVRAGFVTVRREGR